MRNPHDLAKPSPIKRNALLLAIFFSLAAFLGQIFGAWYTGSIALLGDTAHVFTDLFSLVMSLVAVILVLRPSSEVRSFGLYRLEVLAAFINGLLLVFVSLALIYESVDRLLHPQQVLALPLIGISIFGLVMNLFSALVLSKAMKPSAAVSFIATEENPFHLNSTPACGHDHSHGHHHSHGHSHGGHHHSHDRNLNSALMHVLSDALGSVAVILGAICIYFWNFSWVDPVLGIFLSALILRWGAKLIYDAGHVLIEGTPIHIQTDQLMQDLKASSEKISEIEDLHVWEITSSMYAATAEVKVSEMSLVESERLRQAMNKILREKYGIAHTVLAIRPKQ